MFTQFRPDYFFLFSMKQRPEFFSNFGWPDYLFILFTKTAFFESGSTEATKIKQILQRYVIYISDQIIVPYLNTETGNRRLNIVDGMFSLEERGSKSNFSPLIL